MDLLSRISRHFSDTAQTKLVAVELLAVEDARAIARVPTFNGGGAPYFVLIARAGRNYDGFGVKSQTGFNK